MRKRNHLIIILIIIVFIFSTFIIGKNIIRRTNNTELPASTEPSESSLEEPVLSPTIEPTVKPTIEPAIEPTAAPTLPALDINEDIAASSDLKSWIGDYSYYEYVSNDENISYSLSIYYDELYANEDSNGYFARIIINGPQINQDIRAAITVNDTLINLVFTPYDISENDPYREGDILLSLKKNNSNLITIWGELQPLLSSTAKEGTYFEILNSGSYPSKYTDEQTEAAYNDQWKQAFIEYIQNTPHNDDFKYKLIFLDDDNVPELVICSGNEAGGNQICNYYDGTVHSADLRRLGFYYIERENLLCNSEGLMDYYYDIVYSLADGKLTQIAAGDWGELDGTGHQFDKEGNLIYKYRWEDTFVKEDEYKKRLNSVFDMSKAISGESFYSADEIIKIIERY